MYVYRPAVGFVLSRVVDSTLINDMMGWDFDVVFIGYSERWRYAISRNLSVIVLISALENIGGYFTSRSTNALSKTTSQYRWQLSAYF